MGMFDRVMVACPKCGRPMEFQSKAGACEMDTYTVDSAPVEILYDIMNSPQFHFGCGQWVALVDPAFPPGPLPRPALKVSFVKEPDNPDTHPQGFKWWPDDKPFTSDDLLNAAE